MEQINEFTLLDALVKAMTGYSLDQIPEDKKEKLATSCFEIYNIHMQDYFENNFSTKDVMKLKSMSKFDTPSLDTDKDLQTKFLEAHQAVVEKMKF